MTVTSTASVKQYTGNTSTTAFSFPYKTFNTTDFIVTILNSSTLVVTTQVNGGSGTYDYSVAVASDKNSATITFNNAPLSAHKITIERKMSLVQSTDYTPNDNFPAETHEQALDERTLMIQQVQNSYELNTFRFDKNVTDAGVVAINKTVAERGDKFLSFDAAGDLIATQEIGTHRGNWASATAYTVRDLVKDASNSNVYICNTAHTSSGSTPVSSNTDVAKWTLIIDAAAAATSATAAATSATAAATSATAAATSATAGATSATAAATSATAGATSATASATSATASATSATASASSATAAAASAAGIATISAGLPYQFETNTADSDQGAGKIWLNHGTVASATILYIDDDDNNGSDVSAYTATWDDSSATSDKGFIKIQARTTPTDYAIFKISSIGTDNTAYWEFPVTHLVSAGTFSDAEVVDVFFTRSGDSGGVANRTVDTMTGDGSDTTLALSQSPGSTNNCTCFIDGVGQHPGTDFNIAGSTLTFTTAPPNLSVVVAICGGNESIGTPSDNTVTNAKMANNSVDSAELVAGSVDLAHLSATGTPSASLALKGDYSWGTAGGPSLGSGNECVRTNSDEINQNITVPSGTNASSIGPVTVGSSYAITVNGVYTVI